MKEELAPGLGEIEAWLEELVSRRDDLLDIVLRGHLMVERLLERSIFPWLSDVGPFEDARLGFYQKLCLVRALNIRHPKEPLWDALGALNSLRNDFAHRLTSTGREHKVRQFLEMTHSDFPMSNEVWEKTKELPLAQQLGIAFAYILSALEHIRIEYEHRATDAVAASKSVLHIKYGWQPF